MSLDQQSVRAIRFLFSLFSFIIAILSLSVGNYEEKKKENNLMSQYVSNMLLRSYDILLLQVMALKAEEEVIRKEHAQGNVLPPGTDVFSPPSGRT